MQYLLLLFFLTHCSSLFSSHHRKPCSSGSQSLGPVFKRNISSYEFESKFPVDAKRSYDHLKVELERYEKYHSGNTIADKIFWGDLLLAELRIGDADAHVWGCEDLVRPCQCMCICCSSCLPQCCVECPADIYMKLVLHAIDHSLRTCSYTISAHERS